MTECTCTSVLHGCRRSGRIEYVIGSSHARHRSTAIVLYSVPKLSVAQDVDVTLVISNRALQSCVPSTQAVTPTTGKIQGQVRACENRLQADGTQGMSMGMGASRSMRGDPVTRVDQGNDLWRVIS